MPMLTPTEITGRIAWLGVVPDRSESLCSEARLVLEASFDGLEGEAHSGLTRRSCSRVTSQYPKGTEIRNARQVSILSVEELDAIAAAMGLPGLKPEWLGANIVIEGIPDLTRIPPSSRLLLSSGTSIAIDMENGPCQHVSRVIEGHHPGKGAGFVPAARGRRGVLGWVERPGALALGDAVRLHVPPLKPYAPLAG
ncbi:MOSC domain-containing protein [Halovulum dunhuangense]|uniref:MOSC domain-containing protein n=1 Tax=Halovulum dunhuangense TaxID=1505036 RepID=A0A849L4A6_9RHOB|nr:MOSC domain-containing protein [Halovulum dunhuangense]NNU81258.1 MOSC domain-containing protein [Halovulum dunhuangense]